MVRLYDSLAQRMLMLVAFQRVSGSGYQDIARYLVGRLGGLEATNAEQIRLMLQRGNWNQTLDETGQGSSMVDDTGYLVSQLGPRNTTSPAPIIDRLIEILQGPFLRNALTDRTVKSLRRALLLPEEMAGLEQRLNRREMQCSVCDRPIQSGSLVTFYIDGGAMPQMRCIVCQPPTFIPCSEPGCEIINNIPKGLNAALVKGKWTCDDHKHTKPREEARPTVNAVDEAAPLPAFEDLVFTRRIDAAMNEVGGTTANRVTGVFTTANTTATQAPRPARPAIDWNAIAREQRAAEEAAHLARLQRNGFLEETRPAGAPTPEGEPNGPTR